MNWKTIESALCGAICLIIICGGAILNTMQKGDGKRAKIETFKIKHRNF